MKIIGCIPARYASTRLPGKPLRLIAGKPMILHLIERVKKARLLDDVVVLTDDTRIFDLVAATGHPVTMTTDRCRTGTERVIEYSDQSDADVFVNIQGDEILLNPTHIDALVQDFKLNEHHMGTLAHPETNPAVLQDHTTAKVVTKLNGDALYFSRHCIPLQKSGQLPKSALVQIGVYIYSRETLHQLSCLPPAPLEHTESLEQLRALENNIPIHITVVESYENLSVDTPDDLAKAQNHPAFQS